MSKIARIYQGTNEIQKYYQGGVLQRLFFDWKHYIGNELNIEYAKECAGRNVVISGKTYQNLCIEDTSKETSLLNFSNYNRFKIGTYYTIILEITVDNASQINLDFNTSSHVLVSPKGHNKGIYKFKVRNTNTSLGEISSVRLLSLKQDGYTTCLFKNVIVLEGDYTNIDLPTSIDGIESVAEKERNLANYIINAIGTVGEKVVFDNKNCLKITSTFSRNIVLDDTSNYQIYVNAYANNENNKAYSIGNFGGTYIGCGNKTWQGFKMTKYLKEFSIYNYQNSEVYIDLDTLSLVRVNNPYPLKLNVRGKNLFDPNNLESGSINPNSGTNVSNPAQVRSINFIEVKPSTSYMFNDSCRIFEYSKTKGYIGSSVIDSQSFITSSNTYFLKLHKTIPENGLIENIQLEEGTVTTAYEPYRDPTITTINLPIPLRSLPNGVCDTIEGSKLIQRVGYVLFKDISNYTLTNAISEYNRVELILDDAVKDSNRHPIISDKFYSIHDNQYNLNNGAFSASSKIYVCLGLNTVDEYIDWFKNNPTIFLYPLETLTETEITPDMILINGEPITDTVGIELPDGTKDSIENDYYVKRVGKVIIDGKNGTYQKSGTSTSTLDVYVVRNLGINITLKTLNTNYIYQCDSEIDMSKYITVGKWINNKTSGSVIFKIPTEEYLWSDIHNAFLENPITLYVELATPVKIPLFSIKEGLTTLKSTNNINPQIELDCLVRDDFQNMCDNEWESGDIAIATGDELSSSTSRIKLQDYIAVQPNTTYYCDTFSETVYSATGKIGVRYYKNDKTYISGGGIGVAKTSYNKFTTPEDCYYIKFIVETLDTNYKIYLRPVK